MGEVPKVLYNIIMMAVCTGFEPVIYRVTGDRVNHYTNRPYVIIIGSGEQNRTADLRLMIPVLYQLSYSAVLTY